MHYLLMVDDTAQMVLAYAIALLAVISIIIFGTRWLLKINQTAAYQKSSILLLKEIALKLGVEEDAIKKSISHFNKHSN